MTVAQQELLSEIYCRGCGRLVGFGPTDFRIYCDDMCAHDYSIVAMEERDALIEAMAQANPHLAKARIGAIFDISRQRVEQILAARSS